MSDSLQAGRAAEELRRLLAEATTPEVRQQGPAHRAWKAKSDAVMERALGRDSQTLHDFRELRYHVGIWTGAPGEAE